MSIDKVFAYHKPSTEGLVSITRLREAYTELMRLVLAVAPASRERAVAVTELETSAMWAIKAVVSNDKDSEVA